MTEGRTIAIASGKGGVGKTWFAITLAHALARRGSRVLLFDADLGLANVDIQLGLTPEHDLGSVIAGRATLADATLHPCRMAASTSWPAVPAPARSPRSTRRRWSASSPRCGSEAARYDAGAARSWRRA